jgi:hypothetical protein
MRRKAAATLERNGASGCETKVKRPPQARMLAHEAATDRRRGRTGAPHGSELVRAAIAVILAGAASRAARPRSLDQAFSEINF